MLRPRWRKLCTELAHALRSHVISQHDNEVESSGVRQSKIYKSQCSVSGPYRSERVNCAHVNFK